MNLDRSAILIDVNDERLLLEREWLMFFHKNDGWIVVSGVKDRVYLQRLITGASPGDVVSFRNKNRLDFRRQNLSVVSRKAAPGTLRPIYERCSPERLRVLYEQQMLVPEQIAELYRNETGLLVNKGTIYLWLKDAGISVRPPGTHMKELLSRGIPMKTMEGLRKSWATHTRKRLEREANPKIIYARRLKQIEKNRCREAKKRANGGSFTPDQWEALCARYGHRCLNCGEKKPLSADHIIPISKGGSSYISNIQPLCRECNSAKGTQVIDYRYLDD